MVDPIEFTISFGIFPLPPRDTLNGLSSRSTHLDVPICSVYIVKSSFSVFQFTNVVEIYIFHLDRPTESRSI
jgi:hypothetical protein